jgi:gluconate kinase
MNWKDIAKNIGSVAASVAPLLGGPVGMAISIGSQIAGALGTENDPKAVLAELNNNPEAALKLQEWAHQERDQIRQSHVELQRIYLQEYKADLVDRQSARQTHKDHWMPTALVFMLFSLVAAVLWVLFYGPEMNDNRDIINYLIGQLIAMFAASVAYWVSSTKGSKDKDKAINNIQQAAKASFIKDL